MAKPATSTASTASTASATSDRAESAVLFSTRLREARIRMGYSHGDVAELLGVTREGYGRLERGRIMPRADVLMRVARLFHVSTDWLLGLID